MSAANGQDGTVSERASLVMGKAARDLFRLDRLDLARKVCGMALAMDPRPANCHSVMASVHEAAREWDQAIEHWRAAVARAPDIPGHQFNLALAELRAGDCASGFDRYEWRLAKEDWASLAIPKTFVALRHRVPQPGDDLTGKHLVAFTEQGLGDNIWAARWLPMLARRGARVTLLTRTVLEPVLGRIAGLDRILAAPDGGKLAKANLAAWAESCDGFVPLMTLPRLAGVRRAGDMAGATLPWLAPDGARVHAWRQRYAAAAPRATRRIGVVWRASPDSMTSPQRSMAAACLAPLATLEDTQFINLQGGPADGRDALARVLPGSFDPLASGEPPLDEFAAAIAATDLLITIDTMALHLAGSMGHPCWAMLPHAPSFFWGTDGDGCAWYPGMRCFRQTRRGDWSGPVDAVRDALATC